MDPVFAVSFAGTLEKIGAYAGFAAVPGVAVLALLYFSQAREVRRLREWAGRAPERSQELQGRVSEQAARAPARRVSGQPIASRPGTAAARGGASGQQAGGGQPGGTGQAPRPAPTTSGAQAAQPVSPRSGAGSPPAAGRSEDPPSADRSNAVAAPVPAAAAGVAGRVEPGGGGRQDNADNDHRPEGTSAPGMAATAAGGATRTGAPAATPLRTARPTATLPRRQPDGGTYAAHRLSAQTPEPSGSTGRRRGLAVAAAVALVAAIALAVVVISGTAGGGDRSVGAAHAGPASGAPSGGPVVRSRTTVAVLNGTTVPGLASQVAAALERGGFRRGSVTNAADQQRPSTTVDYAPGYQRAAREVGTMLRVRNVAPIDAGTQAIAGPRAGVVVTVGTDRAR